MTRLTPRSFAVFASTVAAAGTGLYGSSTTLGQTVHATVNTSQNVAPISRFIYGVNAPLDGAFSNNTFTRLGGNRWTAYNWANNASNAGKDFQYQNDDFLGGGGTPGGAVIPTLSNASAHNAGALITIPIAGYVSADKNGGGDVRNSGANYLQTRFRVGAPRKGSAFTLTPDPAAPTVYQDEFVNWVKTQAPYMQTDANRPVWFSLDNEPDLWFDTHPEVHPNKVTYAEITQKTIDYAKAIKDVAPGTKIFGPVNYGYDGFTTLQGASDGAGRNFHAYYLQQMKAAEVSAGRRLLDALDVHWYPEAQSSTGVRITGQDNSAAVVAARLQAPRSLWDPTYVENSYITRDVNGGQPIQLINQLRNSIAANYAGTKMAMTEYNYGGGNHISGGIAQADVLGIFGREGMFAANQWQLATSEPYTAAAFKMYRNYDGRNGTFGDTTVSAVTDDVAGTSVYASLDSTDPKHMVLVVLNKTGSPVTMDLSLIAGKQFTTAEVYTLTAALADPQYAGRLTLANPAALTYMMPAYSVSTLNVLAPEPGTVASLLIIGPAAVLGRRRRTVARRA